MSFRTSTILLMLGAILALGVGLRSCATKDEAAAGRRLTLEGDRNARANKGSDEAEAMPSKLPRSEPDPSASAHIRRKLKSIIIPVIAFDETRIEDAIDFLRARSIELDKEEADPARKGISLHIRKPQEDAGAASADPVRMPEEARAIRLTLEARDISLWDALHQIADQAGLKVEITDNGIELRAP